MVSDTVLCAEFLILAEFVLQTSAFTGSGDFRSDPWKELLDASIHSREVGSGAASAPRHDP